MTVLENLWLSGQSRRSRPLWRRNFDRVMSTFPQLASRRKQLCQTLSGGERQMLAIGMGLMGEPKILMLDEPTLGLAPRTKENLCAAIQKIAVDGTPLVTVDQDLEFLITLSSHLYFVNHGTVSSEFDATSRLHHAELIKMYFGRT
jgi:branched-chain amino acid transport system ATP-binding protein